MPATPVRENTGSSSGSSGSGSSGTGRLLACMRLSCSQKRRYRAQMAASPAWKAAAGKKDAPLGKPCGRLKG